MANTPAIWGLEWRSSRKFIIASVTIAFFVDFILFGLVVPVLPFMLQDRLSVTNSWVQLYTSALLSALAAATLVLSLPLGWIANKATCHQPIFLAGAVFDIVGFVTLLLAQNISTLIIARLIQGLGALVVFVTGFTMVHDTVGPEQIGPIFGSIFSIIVIGDTLGPVLGGTLYANFGFIGVFGIASGLIAIDFAMRLFVIDNPLRNQAVGGSSTVQQISEPINGSHAGTPESNQIPRESDALLPKKSDDDYKINGQLGTLTQAFPILYCLRDPRFFTAMSISVTHTVLISLIQATIPTESGRIFGFSSFQVGLLLIAYNIAYFSTEQITGYIAGKCGIRAMATGGFMFLAVSIMLLGIFSHMEWQSIPLFCVILAMHGIGLSIVGTPAMADAGEVMEKYDTANPRFFGEKGVVQLNALNIFFLFIGLTMGPVLAGILRVATSYLVTTAVFAGLSALTGIISFAMIGDRK